MTGMRKSLIMMSKVAFMQLFEGDGAVGGDIDVVAFRLQQIGERLGDFDLVVHQKHACAAPGWQRSASAHPGFAVFPPTTSVIGRIDKMSRRRQAYPLKAPDRRGRRRY